MIDGQGDPVALSPPVYARHEAAVRYVEGQIRTRAPWPSSGRFPGVAPGAWGRLASGATITAASGLTLGQGQVKLCDNTGTVFPEDETVGVRNAGSAINATSGPRIVRLTWTKGDWAVSCPGGT
jgi:hypothetical protein